MAPRGFSPSGMGSFSPPGTGSFAPMGLGGSPPSQFGPGTVLQASHDININFNNYLGGSAPPQQPSAYASAGPNGAFAYASAGNRPFEDAMAMGRLFG